MLLQECHPLFVAKACGYISRTVDWLRFSVHLFRLRYALFSWNLASLALPIRQIRPLLRTPTINKMRPSSVFPTKTYSGFPARSVPILLIVPRCQLQLVRLHSGPLRAWQLASLRCPCPIRSRPLAASWDSSIHHRIYGSQASSPSPCCGYGRWWERRSLASSQNRDVELADIELVRRPQPSMCTGPKARRPSGKDGRS
jgi:hypothetical protein